MENGVLKLANAESLHRVINVAKYKELYKSNPSEWTALKKEVKDAQNKKQSTERVETYYGSLHSNMVSSIAALDCPDTKPFRLEGDVWTNHEWKTLVAMVEGKPYKTFRGYAIHEWYLDTFFRPAFEKQKDLLSKHPKVTLIDFKYMGVYVFSYEIDYENGLIWASVNGNPAVLYFSYSTADFTIHRSYELVLDGEYLGFEFEKLEGFNLKSHLHPLKELSESKIQLVSPYPIGTLQSINLNKDFNLWSLIAVK